MPVQERVQLIQHIEGYQEDIRELVWLLEELDDERQSCADTLQSLVTDVEQARSETWDTVDRRPSDDAETPFTWCDSLIPSCHLFCCVMHTTLCFRVIRVDRGVAWPSSGRYRD
jgi:hypothetical protein